MKEGVYLMEAIFNVLPFLVFLFLLWFTYINISYAFNLRQARKEDRTLTSCLSDTGKYFYIILLIIYICILSIFIIFFIFLQQVIYVGHRQMMIGKIKLDYRKIKRVTYPKSSKLRFIYGQKSYETSLRFIDDFKLKKALQKTR